MSKPRYLIAFDFDETLFHTFSRSTNGMDVKKAYRLALDDIFGGGTGEWFFDLFGLNGRTPSEVISSIMNWDQEFKVELIKKANTFYKENEGNFQYPIPECRDGKIKWDTNSPETVITQMLVGQKLQYLLGEIGVKDNLTGKVWPSPCKDALTLLGTLRELKNGGYPIDSGIISSGHREFIKKTLRVWDAPEPDVLVTEDEIRPRKYPTEIERRFKPGVFPLALAHHEWLKIQDQRENGWKPSIDGRESKTRMLYIGDDPKKDLLMASYAGIKGYLYPFTPFKAINEALIQNRHLLDGRPIAAVFTEMRNGIEVDSLKPDSLELKQRSRSPERL